MSVNGIVIYRGPSEIDGGPILAIATGLVVPSTNRKTGPIVQLWLLSDSRHPWEAAQLGHDVSICGNCSHRGEVVDGQDGQCRNVGRSCYVALSQAPSMVWKAYRRGLYQTVTPVMAQRILAKRQIRLGAYGDVSCLPTEIIDVITAKAAEVVGYTTRWRERPELSRWCMASVSSPNERKEAKLLGFRTFRVRGAGEPVLTGEGICPASREMNRATRCSECALCSGTQGTGIADITLKVHGSGAAHFEKRKLLDLA